MFSSNGAVFNDTDLKRFKAVVWNNVSGDVLTNTQRAALKAYVEGGGGFAAFHGSGGDPFYDWDWYVDTLIGARFIGAGWEWWPQRRCRLASRGCGDRRGNPRGARRRTPRAPP